MTSLQPDRRRISLSKPGQLGERHRFSIARRSHCSRRYPHRWPERWLCCAAAYRSRWWERGTRL